MHLPPRVCRAAAAACTGCELYERATQTVFGAGPATARVMLLGEQPGGVEDQRGTQHRGELLTWPDPGTRAEAVVATIHPSAILRAGANRERMYAGLVADLRLVSRG